MAVRHFAIDRSKYKLSFIDGVCVVWRNRVTWVSYVIDVCTVHGTTRVLHTSACTTLHIHRNQQLHGDHREETTTTTTTLSWTLMSANIESSPIWDIFCIINEVSIDRSLNESCALLYTIVVGYTYINFVCKLCFAHFRLIRLIYYL